MLPVSQANFLLTQLFWISAEISNIGKRDKMSVATGKKQNKSSAKSSKELEYDLQVFLNRAVFVPYWLQIYYNYVIKVTFM